MSSDAPVVITERRGAVLVITLNRPEAMNAIDSGITDGLVAALDTLNADPTLTLGVLGGNGRGFCSGMDLKAFAAGGVPRGLDRLLQQGSAKPLIAAVEGFALAGGLELALVCDLIVAAENAKFGIPEVKVGLFAAGGGILRLQQRMTASAAVEMALTGEPILAPAAAAAGLVARVCPKGEAMDTAIALAEQIAKNAPLAVAATAQLLRASRGLTDEEFFAHQAPLVAPVFKSEDAKEGPRAFAAKRAPEWTGK